MTDKNNLFSVEENLFDAEEEYQRVRSYYTQHHDERDFGQRVADRVAATVGSWKFIIGQSCILGLWIFFNSSGALGIKWDEPPFIFLNLCLSFQAAYTAPLIMISQRRQEDRDRVAAQHHYDSNNDGIKKLLELHDKVDELKDKKWSHLLDIQEQQINYLTKLTENK